MPEFPNFTTLLNRYMDEKDRPARWLAKQIGVETSTVTRWRNHENPSRPGNPELISKIGKALELDNEQVSRLFYAAGYETYVKNLEILPAQAISTPGTDVAQMLRLLLGQLGDINNQAVPYPDSDIPRNHRNKLFEGHEELVQKICGLLDRNSINQKKFVVLHGPRGAGKKRIANEVARRLESKVDSVIFHSIDHLTKSDDANDAVQELIYRISKCLHISTNENIGSQKIEIWKRIENHDFHVVIVLDGLRSELEDVFINYLNSLPRTVKVFITHNGQLDSKFNYLITEYIPLLGVTQSQVLLFLKECGSETALSEEDIQKIYNKTQGNSFALRQIAIALNAHPSQKLDDILGVISNPEGDVAEEWVGGTFKELPPRMKLLLKTHSIFRHTVDERILAEIAEFDLHDPVEKEEFDGYVKHLCDSLRAFSRNPNSVRTRMDEPYRTFVKEILENDETEKQEILGMWVKCYENLRARTKTRPHDKAGWTIFSDYHPDGKDRVSYEDEIETIGDVVKYCLSEKRSDNYWRTAVNLLDDFRATLFATGRWSERIEWCNQALQKCKKDEDLIGDEGSLEYKDLIDERAHVAGQLMRMIAWMYCFKDDYDRSAMVAKSALAIAQKGIESKKPPEMDKRTMHRQTCYKSLNTLGQIALRRGQDAAIRGQIIQRKLRKNAGLPVLMEEKANSFFSEAQMWFEQARDYFLKAYGSIYGEYPNELLMVQYHMAEVSYYNRHFYGLKSEHEKNFTRSRLMKSKKLFEEVYEEAKDREHERLIAHTRYYLGKVSRRLARYFEGDEKRLYLKDALEHFEAALKRAEEYKDFVLKARIQYAMGQWFNDSKMSYEKDTPIDSREEARKLLLQAATALAGFGMKVECADAVAFLQEHFEKEKISEELLSAFNEQYGDVIDFSI